MLERIILKILNENGFDRPVTIKSDFFKSTYFTFRKDNEKLEYYIVTTINQEKFIEMDQIVFSSLSKQVKKSTFYTAETDKNTSLVICVDKNNALDKDLLERIELKCEENPYFFKKYVLSYDEDIVNKIFKSISNKGSTITQYIESIVLDPTEFAKFKFNIVNNEEYQLLSKLIMKVPIIPIKIPDINTVDPLSEMIMRSVEMGNLQKAQTLINYMSNNSEASDEVILEQIVTNWKQG